MSTNSTNETNSPLLNKADVCGRFKISARTLEYWVARGEFPPPKRLGRYVLWSEAAVKRWEDNAFAYQLNWNPGR